MTRHLPAATALTLLALAPLILGPFTVTLLGYVGIYSLAALGLVLLTGIGGIVSFGQAAFVGIAAYTTAYATTAYPISPWLGLVLALAVTCTTAALVGALTLRLRGHFLSLSTVAWGLAIYYLFGTLDGLGGHNGIANIPPITAPFTSPPIPLTGPAPFYLIWATVAAALLLTTNILRARPGRAMHVLRGGNILAESLGIDPFRTRLTLFVLSAALSGWLYAHLGRFVSPSSFNVEPGIEYLMMAMVGGSGHILGAVLGATLVTLLKNTVQDWLPRIAPGAAGQLEIVVFSLLFILVLQRARNGLAPLLLNLLPTPSPSPPPPAPPMPRRTQPEPGHPLLEVENLVRRFGGLTAVDDVTFTVNTGEILGLIGPNGAGKTTLFNLVTAALPPTAGRIAFAGRPLPRTQRQAAQAGIARTFQHVKLRPRMTLLDTVLLGTHTRTTTGLLAAALTLDRTEDAAARHEALRHLHRTGLANPHALAGTLPLGQQRLLEIARALAADPLLLVLDEPAAGLRRPEKQALATLLKTLQAERLTILLVEHDMDFLMSLADRVVVMQFGTKLTEGDPAHIRADPKVREAYLGPPG